MPDDGTPLVFMFYFGSHDLLPRGDSVMGRA